MSSELRLRLTVVGSLVLASPSLRAWLGHELSLTVVAGRYVAALLLCWVAFAGLDRLLSGYTATTPTPSPSPAPASPRSAEDAEHAEHAEDAAPA